ncbi:hypothetical protein ACB092_06G215200 [Castanea dentata]
MAATKVSLKLLIDSKGQRVLFAEAGKEFVDFLITILALPVGTSIESLSDTYLQPKQNKDSLLKPKVYISGGGVVPLQLPNIESSTSRKFYRCVQGHAYVSDDRTTTCPSCMRLSMTMTSELTYVDSRSGNNSGSSSEGGYVKGVVTYMVMDDLVVKPMSTISSITLLNNFNVKDVGALEEKVVDLGMEEGVKLLKASLQSKNVLTDVFLPKLEREVNLETEFLGAKVV